MDIKKLKYAADIGKINIDKSKIEDLKTELEHTLIFLETINKLKLKDESEEKQRTIKLEDLREDVVIDSCVSQDILENVPNRLDDYVKVPKIMKKNIKGK